jgi:hypothetical protein
VIAFSCREAGVVLVTELGGYNRAEIEPRRFPAPRHALEIKATLLPKLRESEAERVPGSPRRS